ncbi:MAG TPA: hypothetical protein VFG43_05660 [Geminicoccaceae bacterium]|nr:hypothetical protein [Geminicoccaceae bacterium]
MRYRVTWTGMVEKTVAIETAADALYHVWSRYRGDFVGGSIKIDVDEGGPELRLAQLSFPVSLEREIEAPNAAEAVRSFLYDDRVPSLVHVQDIQVVPVPDELMARAASVAAE